MRLVIAAGGTGGHLFPGLAVGEVLLARGHEVLLLTSEKEIDDVATRNHAGFHIQKISGEGLQSMSPWGVARFLRKLFTARRQCKALYDKWNPSAVLGMGGFTCFAPILVGKKRGLPAFVHESNAIPGRANRWNAKHVTRVLLGFEECRPHFSKVECKVVGTPIRSALRQPVERSAARAAFGLAREKNTLLIMGGSQGARSINRLATQAASRLAECVQVIHLTGKADESTARDAYAKAGIRAYVATFHHAMQEAYAAADLAVARSGAASLAELGHFGIPSILIPFPFAAENHQTANALIFQRAGAGILMEENALTGDLLAAKITELIGDSPTLADMSRKSRSLSRSDAAETVADTILEFCR